jgi:hypothetical protein
MLVTKLVVALITANFSLYTAHYTSLRYDSHPGLSQPARYIKLALTVSITPTLPRLIVIFR